MQTGSNRRRTVTRIGLIAVIILLLAYFVEWDQVITILRQTNWLVLLAGVIFLSIGFIFISVRWRFVLVDKPNLKATFHADSIGYMVTILSPIPGPALRVFALSHSTKVSISSAAPAIVVDLLLTTVMRLVALILALNIVLAPAEKEEHGAVPDEKSLMSMAIYPMGLPLLINPGGIVLRL